MTIGERNKYIIRLHKKGLTVREIQDKINATASIIRKTIERYNKEGDVVFMSKNEWIPDEVNEELLDISRRERIERQELINAYSFRKNRELLKDSMSEGDKVKFVREGEVIRGTVCDIQPFFAVIRNLNNPPCEKCDKGGSECEMKCRKIYHPQRLFDICRIYWIWFNRLQVYTPTYTELLKNDK